MKHSNKIKYYDDLEALSEQLGDLYYDTLADFLDHLSKKILHDSHADMQRGRTKLSGHLIACAKNLELAATEIQQAWEICEPHVLDKDKRNNINKTMKNNNSRSTRRNIAQETLNIIKKGAFETPSKNVLIKNDIDSCARNTQLYTPNDLANLCEAKGDTFSCKIEVRNETTLQGAKRLFDSGLYKRIGVLNFASAKNAGGGF